MQENISQQVADVGGSSRDGSTGWPEVSVSELILIMRERWKTREKIMQRSVVERFDRAYLDSSVSIELICFRTFHYVLKIKCDSIQEHAFMGENTFQLLHLSGKCGWAVIIVERYIELSRKKCWAGNSFELENKLHYKYIMASFVIHFG